MKKIKKKKDENPTGLPKNVGAIEHPVNKNYISFTTFKGDGISGDDLLNAPRYPEAFKKLVTVSDYQYFKSIKEASNLKEGVMPFFVPHTLVYYDDLPPGWGDAVNHFCKRYKKNGKDDTVVVLRFYEYDPEEDFYYPVDVGIKDRQLVQYDPDEEEE